MARSAAADLHSNLLGGPTAHAVSSPPQDSELTKSSDPQKIAPNNTIAPFGNAASACSLGEGQRMEKLLGDLKENKEGPPPKL